MSNSISNQMMESLSNKITEQAKFFTHNAFLSFVYTSDVLNRYLELQMKKHGANPIRYSILNVLITHKGRMKPTDLSKRLFRSKTTVTRVIDGLEKEGLVIREPIGKDRRTRQVAVTPKGLELIEKTMPARNNITNIAMSCFNKKQINALDAMLKVFRKHLLIQIDKS